MELIINVRRKYTKKAYMWKLYVCNNNIIYINYVYLKGNG